MEKSISVIRKVGNQYCVFSHDGKNLGCSTSQGEAEKRLQQVEYFKHLKGSDMNYNQAFDNMGKALSHVDPKLLGQVPEAHIAVKTVSDTLRSGTIANRRSERLLDNKDHFPVITETQAQSSIARVYQLVNCPDWYNGTLAQLRRDVYDGIMGMHPGIVLNVRVPVEQTTALSDGQTPPETSQKSIKDPEDDRKKDLVPQVQRPNLSSAQFAEAMQDESTRKTVAGRLMEMLDGQLAQMQVAKQLAERLLDDGLTSEEYDKLSTYIQQDVLNELMILGAKATSIDRRLHLIEKMSNKNG